MRQKAKGDDLRELRFRLQGGGVTPEVAGIKASREYQRPSVEVLAATESYLNDSGQAAK